MEPDIVSNWNIDGDRFTIIEFRCSKRQLHEMNLFRRKLCESFLIAESVTES